jgi:NAD(P)-dependent dehydrogenase (short-subunit alcohol dehydrogenase family)
MNWANPVEMTLPFLLTDRHILITGASSGIGRQCAITCSQLGARVSLLGRNAGRLQETLQGMENPEAHRIFAVDLLDYDQVENTVKTSVAELGKFHGLVNSAGISTILPLKSVSVKKMEAYVQANVYTAYQLSRMVTKSAFFAEEGGSLVFIASVMAEVGEVGRSLYGLTKGALVAASKSLSVELAKRHIRVNCLSPGVVVTPMSARSVYQQDKAALQKVVDMHPLGLGKPEDVAAACAFLLSDAARWITGVNLPVDGGYMAR